MEAERLAKEAEEKEKQEREKKVKEQFSDTNAQWEQDKTQIQNLAKEAQKEREAESQQGSSQDSKAAADKVGEKSNNNQFRVEA
ncbi:hypothetical protein PC116_g29995 [Phytophthora cactorum]|nr:hypothetical protein PC116_g29995 [Phytophthora cactorum]